MSTKHYYNYIVISFSDLIEKINVDVINYYFDNGIELVKINKDFKKIFVHFLIKNLCSQCLVVKGTSDKILFCDPNFISSKSEIFESIEYAQYIDFLKNVLKEIEGLIPITIYYSIDVKFDEVSEKAFVNDLKFNFDYVHSKGREKKSLRKLSQYAEHLGLNFIHKDYLNQLSLHKIFI